MQRLNAPQNRSRVGGFRERVWKITPLGCIFALAMENARHRQQGDWLNTYITSRTYRRYVLHKAWGNWRRFVWFCFLFQRNSGTHGRACERRMLGCAQPYISCSEQHWERWPRIRNAGIDSGRILDFFRSGSGVNFSKKQTRSDFLLLAVAGVCAIFLNGIA